VTVDLGRGVCSIEIIAACFQKGVQLNIEHYSAVQYFSS